MSSFVVQIRNYQRIKKADIKFVPGLNVIVGSSNQGKSASQRAILTAVFNLSRDSHITVGANVSAVGIGYNGHKVIWKRDLSKASKTNYVVDGETYTKVGKGQLKVVADALGIREVDFDEFKERLNFQKQMSYPFLLDKTPSQVFKFLANSAEEDNLLDVLSKMKTDLKGLQSAIVINTTKADTLKSSMENEYEACKKIDKVLPVSRKILSVDSQVQKFKSLKDSLVGLKSLASDKGIVESSIFDVSSRLGKFKSLKDCDISSLERLGNVLGELQLNQRALDDLKLSRLSKEHNLEVLKSLPSVDEFDGLDQLYASLSELKRECFKKEELFKSIRTLSSSLRKSDALVEFLYIRLKELEQREKDKESLSVLISELTGSIKESEYYSKSIESLKSQIAEVSKELLGFKVCPYCGSSLKEESCSGN